jgi:hypothetical protein
MKTQLSSSLTILYRFVIPFFLISIDLMALYFTLFVLPTHFIGFFMLAIPVFAIASGVLIFQFVKLSDVFFDSESLIYLSKSSQVGIPLKYIKKMERISLNYIYKITYVDHSNGDIRSITFIPRIREVFFH